MGRAIADMETAFGLIYVLWCGLCWVLRGGLFGKLCRDWLGVEPGTTLTRIGCALLMAAPLVCLTPWATLCWFSIYAGMTIGYFGGSMGQERQPRDALLMAGWGLAVLTLSLAPTAILEPSRPLLGALGILAGPIYWANHRLGNGRFDWTQRSEWMVGMVMGVGLLLAFL